MAAVKPAPAPPAAPAPAIRLHALQPVRHDGVRHAPGDLFTAPLAQAAALVACGAAEFVAAAAGSPP